MTYTFIVTVTPKLGQNYRETHDEVSGVLSDLRDYQITVPFQPYLNNPAKGVPTLRDSI